MGTNSAHAPNMVSLRALVVVTVSVGMMCGLIGGYVGHVLGGKLHEGTVPTVHADTTAIEDKFKYNAKVCNSIEDAIGKYYKITKKEKDFGDVMKKCEVEQDYIDAYEGSTTTIKNLIQAEVSLAYTLHQ